METDLKIYSAPKEITVVEVFNENSQSTGSMHRESQYFKELEIGIYQLIQMSNVPDIVKIKGAKMYHSRYFVRLNARKFRPRQLLGILRAIIEHSNYEFIKNDNAGI